MSSLDYLDLCRLCLVKDQVSVSIFDDGESKSRHIYPKIVACLSVKVDPEDKLPKKICDGCAYKLDLFYDFYNTTATAEKQLWMWLEGIGLEDKQNYIANDMNSSLMKQEQGENRLNVAQASAEHQNMSLNMIDNMGLTMPIIMSPDQAISVPISSSETVQTVQSIAGPSLQSQMARKEREDDEETTEDDNTEDEIDHDEGLPVKEEHEDGRIIEPTTFVNVTAMACDEAGPSGLQQKLPEMTMQAADVDPKSGSRGPSKLTTKASERPSYACDKCSMKFPLARMLRRHQRGSRKKNKLRKKRCYKCLHCTFTCENIEILAEHKVTVHVEPVKPREKCDMCDYECTKKSTLSTHKRKYHLDSGKIYWCNECSFKSEKKASLYSHVWRKHRSTSGLEMYYCGQCDYKNKNKYELKIHIMRKHTKEFKFSCEVCEKKFKVRGDLTNHVRFTHREEPVICDVCGKICLNSNSLYVHQKFAHYKAKFECHLCKRRMVSQENLDEHMLRQHEKREKAVCEECGKTFSRNSRLKVHMRIHTGDKPYPCTVCDKAFARRTAMKQHLLIHTGVRPYICDLCGKTFTQKPGLISHRKSHPGSHPPLPRVPIDHILNGVMKK